MPPGVFMHRIAILTRPAGRNDGLARKLQAGGWQTLELPALAIEPLRVPAAQLPRPQDHDLVVFVSGIAARLYLEQLALAGTPRWPAAAVAATVGPASAAAVRAWPGFGPDARLVHPSPEAPRHDSEALWDELARQGVHPRRALLVRATQGRDWLAERLAAAGAEVRRHETYRRRPAAWPDGTVRRLREWQAGGGLAVWLATSSEGIDAAHAVVRRLDLLPWWAACRFVVTHPRLSAHLAARLAEDGLPAPATTPCVPDEDAIAQAFAAS